MSELVGNPEDLFSRVMARMFLHYAWPLEFKIKGLNLHFYFSVCVIISVSV